MKTRIGEKNVTYNKEKEEFMKQHNNSVTCIKNNNNTSTMAPEITTIEGKRKA